MKGMKTIRGSNPGPSPRRNRLLGWGLYGIAAVPYVLLARYLWFLTDDAFISFRYARNWAAGLGLRFNPLEHPPVEGFSNFLWTALLAGLDLLGGDMVRLAPWISFFLGLILLGLLLRCLLRDLGSSPGAAFLGLLCAALSPAYAVWSTSGLETMLFTFWLFLAFRDLLAGPDRPRPVRAGLWAALAALTRPEGIIWALGFAGVALLRSDGASRSSQLKRMVLYVSVVLLLFMPYFISRCLYFGYPLPNTFYAKSGGGMLTVLRGLNYTVSYLLCFGTPLLILLASFLCLRGGTPAPAFYSALIGFGMVAYSVMSGGDFMAMGRFMAPSVPFFAVTATHLLDRYLPKERKVRPGWIAAASALVMIQLLPAFQMAPVPESLRRFFHFRWNSPTVKTELEQWRQMKRNLYELTLTGKALKEVLGPEGSFVSAAIGAVGYYSDWTIHDMCGLVDLEVARRHEEDPVPRSAGHDKYVEPEFFLSRKPTVLRARAVPRRHRREAEADFAESLPPGYRVEILSITPRSGEGRSDFFLIMQRRIE
jgi:hypothetical protein